MILKVIGIVAFGLVGGYLVSRRISGKPFRLWLDFALLLAFLISLLVFGVPEIGLNLLRLSSQ